MTTFSVNATDFRNALSLVGFCASKDESRFTLNGIKLMVNDNIMTLVATDGHRLSIHTLSCESSGDTDILCGKDIVKTLMSAAFKPLKYEMPLEFNVDCEHLTVKYDACSVTHELVDGVFPDYSAVLPDEEKYGADNKHGDIVSALYLGEVCKAVGKQSDFVSFLYHKTLHGNPVVVKTRIEGYTHIIMPKTGC